MHSVAVRTPWEGACTSLRSSRNHESRVATNSRPCVVRCGVAEPDGKPVPFGQLTRYNDNLLDKAFMALFRRKMEQFTGKSTPLQGYEGFVDVSKKIMQGRTAVEQRAVVRNVLLSLLPPGAPAQFRKLFPPTKWSAEVNAAITVPFFQWLVGPAELMEIEVNGVKQMSGVKITKCRYLENSGCVGMCVNMCKIPTQDFFTNEFGLPLTMTPNFEDMSCEMFYGQAPPPIAEDPAIQQPCFASMCSIAPPKSTACPKLQVAQDLSPSEVSLSEV
ncbi:hypothetical protein KC19_1G063300 [Ceratodon purpureus]|uniref:Beta-carotene isomerase D27-like C-terminal domain-containing protein n=1 Tax=Ceratodon purpureus TaxID=3225 RepID=A0A8T0J387_CERPU|nr:hypothetical protein KC19_1G063300 [Ceratodon purpureus]